MDYIFNLNMETSEKLGFRHIYEYADYHFLASQEEVDKVINLDNMIIMYRTVEPGSFIPLVWFAVPKNYMEYANFFSRHMFYYTDANFFISKAP